MTLNEQLEHRHLKKPPPPRCRLAGWWLVAGWLVARLAGWWLVAGWLVAGGWLAGWLLAGWMAGWWLVGLGQLRSVRSVRLA